MFQRMMSSEVSHVIDTFDLIKDKLASHKIWILFGSIICIGCIALFLIKQPSVSETPSALSATTSHPVDSSSSAISATSTDSAIMIDVKGAVKNPGVYDVVSSPRAQTAIAKAGGLTREADTVQFNLAQKLTDGQMIYVPVVGEVKADKSTGNQQATVASQENAKVNLNTATAEELQMLDGVGEKKAEQIIAYREAHDGFKKIDDIKEVSGIGAKRFETLQDKVTI